MTTRLSSSHSLWGGPASYTNEDLERAHSSLGITESAFLEAGNLLSETLEDFGVDSEDLQALCREFMSRQNFIVEEGHRLVVEAAIVTGTSGASNSAGLDPELFQPQSVALGWNRCGRTRLMGSGF